MGGNALKNTPTRRYQKDEYFKLSDTIMRLLGSIETVKEFRLIPAYRQKESFGDMDILYTGHINSVDVIKDVFNPNEVVRNGDCISFDFRALQIDLIHTSTLDYSLCYFSYNDLGNLIGKLARKIGLKHGHAGLYFPARFGDHYLKELLLTTDHNRTLELLQLDVDQFHRGFDTLEDIFDFVMASPYYDHESYKLENLNHVARVRDKKRTTYSAFLDYCKKVNLPSPMLSKDKRDYIPMVYSAFPEKFGEFEETVKHISMLSNIRQKFNGDVVSSLVNLTGKDLGKFMVYLRARIEFREAVLAYLDDVKIKENILRAYNEYTNTL